MNKTYNSNSIGRHILEENFDDRLYKIIHSNKGVPIVNLSLTVTKDIGHHIRWTSEEFCITRANELNF